MSLMQQEKIRDLIPHAGEMCLLEALIEWDAQGIVCVARSHRAKDNPLRRDGRLRAICGIEYAAQAMALHGALTAQTHSRPRAGYLASVRELACRVAYLDEAGAEISISAQLLMAENDRVIYAFALSDGNHELLSGRAAVVLSV